MKRKCIISIVKTYWWKNSIGYIIYPASFYDANNDGIGDLGGIIKKMKYLKELGINLIWICPFLDSPMDDNGYDVKDYLNVNPLFGTNKDLEKLLKVAHKNKIKLLLDFTINHTSDEHKWFIEAKRNKNGKERDYYIFKNPQYDKNNKMIPPTNWMGFFATSCWEYDKESNMYYMHIFSKKMPDLNWKSKDLQNEFIKISNHYLDMGFDGFRLDAVAHLAKDETFENIKSGLNSDGLALDPSKFSNRPKLYEYLDILNKNSFSKYDIVTVGEVGGGIDPLNSLKYNELNKGPIDMVFNFDTAWCNGAYGSIDKRDEEIVTDLVSIKKSFKRWYDTCYAKVSSLPIYWCNHDHPRVLSQYGNVAYRNESMKMLLTVLLFLYGTPFLYYGDEIGMSNVNYKNIEDFMKADVGDKNYVTLDNGKHSKKDLLHFFNRTSRVNARTPMQWNNKKYAGFSKHLPIIRENDNYLYVNVKNEKKEKNSILNYAKKAIKIRKESIYQALVHDEFLDIDEIENKDIFIYSHGHDKEIVVIANFREYDVFINYDISKYNVILHNYETTEQKMINKLRPFECLLIEKYKK